MKITRLPREIDSEDLVAIQHNIASNIRLARMHVGLTQAEMGTMLGYDSATALSLMETGQRKISATTLWKIAHITGEPVNNFYLKGLIPSNDTPHTNN